MSRCERYRSIMSRDGITEIMVYYDSVDNSQEVYYKRSGYPYMFAFGLSPVVHLSDVFEIAEKNIRNYEEEMFN